MSRSSLPQCQPCPLRVMGVKKQTAAVVPRFQIKLRRRRGNMISVLFTILVVTPIVLFLKSGPEIDPDELEALSAGIALASGLGSIAAVKVQPEVSTIIYQPEPCNENGYNIFTLFMVISSPENRRARNETRAGLKLHINNYKGIRTNERDIRPRRNVLLFFIGMSPDPSIQENVEQEARMYQDIVLDNMPEAYLRLTQKTLRMLKWVRNNCPAAEFVIKIDDDVHLNLYRFYTYLESIFGIEQRLDFVGGHLIQNSTPIRDPNSKWFVPMQFWPRDNFPDYVAGYIYVLGRRALERIYEASLNYPIFHMEDVFVTGVIASEKLRLNLTALPNILYEWNPMHHLLASSCDVQIRFLAVHFRIPYWNYYNCWSRFNSRNFVCDHLPLIFDPECW